MSKFLGNHKNEYQDIIYLEANNKIDIYTAYNKQYNRDVTLKIINKEKFKDINLEKLNKEKEIIDKCKSDNILNIYNVFEVDNNFILEQEDYEKNMHEYITDNGPLNNNKIFFKQIAIEMAEALKILYDNKIMHRKIKSSSIFLKNKNDKYKIKLGNFEQAIYIKDNKSEPLDSFYYTAPEIINGDKYDEKSDLWSFGITLYDLYFGDIPYGYKPSKMKIIKALNSEDNFKYEKSNIPLLDIIFDGLLKINPDERISFEELFDIILEKDFMDKNAKYIKTNEKNEVNSLTSSLIGNNIKEDNNQEVLSSSLREGIIKEDNQDELFVSLRKSRTNEIINKEEINVISSSLRASKIKLKNKKEKYNNILYYNENNINYESLLNAYNFFDQETPGTFIFCPNMESFQLIKEEIKTENKENNKIKFNLITTENNLDKIIDIISNDKEFSNCFENKCFFCSDLLKYEDYKNRYQNIFYDYIYNKKGDIANFIYSTSNEKISLFKINELITYTKYSINYIPSHKKILKYFDEFNEEKNKKYYDELEKFINNKDEKVKMNNKSEFLDGFKNIKDNNFLSIYIENIYENLNHFLIEDINNEECIKFFTARIMASFLKYRYEKDKYYNWGKDIYYGTNLKLSELLQYERTKEKIAFPNFSIFYEK